MSGSVATALRLTGGEDAKETAKFVDFFDKFFDCLNVGDFETGMKTRNTFKAPYRSSSDFHLKVQLFQFHMNYYYVVTCIIVIILLYTQQNIYKAK